MLTKQPTLKEKLDSQAAVPQAPAPVEASPEIASTEKVANEPNTETNE